MRPRTRAAILLLLAGLAVAHIAFFGTWAVEDAAISWAYAQNLADGLGPVPWPGSEPVEGYSNPSWVALLTLGALAGLHPFWGSKLLAMALTALTVPVVYHLARRVVPEAPTPAGLTAAALFALNSQVGIFGAAGLENPLFNLLLAGGLLALFREEAEGGAPWSALWFSLLATTRPDGIGYGVLIGLLSTLARIRRGAGRVAIARWWTALLGPLLVYNFGRWMYFGWELPATAYAKLDQGRAHLWAWRSPGWVYAREWAVDSGQWLFAWVYLLGMSRGRRLETLLGLALLGAAAALYLVPGHTPALGLARVGITVAVGAVLWASSQRRLEDGPRGTLLAVACAALFFAVYARGDWMKGGRWFAMAAVPGAVLLAAGMVAWLGPLRRGGPAAIRPVLLVGMVVGFGHTQLAFSRWFSEVLEISPWSVRERVWRGQQLARELFVDERPRGLTVDMGAFLMWSGWEMNDVVGLTDMPMAQQRATPWFQPFMEQYLLEERRPHLILLGETEARLLRIPAFRQVYTHSLNQWLVRRDLLYVDRWTGPPGREVRYPGTALRGWDFPAQPASPGTSLYLEYAVDTWDERATRWWVFLVDEDGATRATWELPRLAPEPAEWPEGAIYRGRHTLDLPDDLGPGAYRVGFAARSRDSLYLPDPDHLPPGAETRTDPDRARVLPGEVLFADTVVIGTGPEAQAAAERERRLALDLAASGDCEGAARSWFLARQHGVRHTAPDRAQAEQLRARARCWMDRAEADPAHRVDHLERARRTDPDTPGLADRLQAEADRLQAEGDRARKARKAEAAYAAYRDALRLDPYRPWARRYAEEARAYLLARQLEKG